MCFVSPRKIISEILRPIFHPTLSNFKVQYQYGLADWWKQGEAKRLITQLSDVTKRDRAAQDLIRIGADPVIRSSKRFKPKMQTCFPYISRSSPVSLCHADIDQAASHRASCNSRACG